MPPAQSPSASRPRSAPRRKRRILSCDDCRDRKRRCDKRQPCSNCLRKARPCKYSTQNCAPGITKAQHSYLIHTSPRLQPSATRGVPIPLKFAATPYDSLHNSNGDMAVAPEHVTLTTTVTSLLSQRIFVKALLTIWFRELDYMYDIVSGTQAEALLYFGDGLQDEGIFETYSPLLAAILALTAQLQGPDLDVVLHTLFDPLLSSKTLVEPAHGIAKGAVDRLLDAPNDENEGHTLLPEYLQASLLVCSFYKNAGQMDRYHGRMYRDISCMLHASYHVLDSFLPCVNLHQQTAPSPTFSPEHAQKTPRSVRALRPDQRGLVRRIFWAYFTCDRLYLMIAGPTSSYALVSEHCNIWLYGKEGEGRIEHIRELCNTRDGPASLGLPKDDRDANNGAHSVGHTRPGSKKGSRSAILSRLGTSEGPFTGGLSRYAVWMVRVAALAGRCSDQISFLRTAQPQQLDCAAEATNALRAYEEDLADFRADCLHMATVVEDQLNFLEKDYKSARKGDNCDSAPPSVSLRKETDETRKQHHILMLTICRLRRDVALSLGLVLYSTFRSIRPWLDFKERVTARALLKMVTLVPVDVPPRALGWIFYLHYIAEPATGLIKSLSNVSGTELTPEEAKESLYYALKGRNLLCLIAAQSGVSHAYSLATRVCHQLSSTLSPLLGDVPLIGDAQLQVEVGQVTEQFYQSRIRMDPRLHHQQMGGQNGEPLHQQGGAPQPGNEETLREEEEVGISPSSFPTFPNEDHLPRLDALLAQDGYGEEQLTSLFASSPSSFMNLPSSSTLSDTSMNLNTESVIDAWEALFNFPLIQP